MAGGDDAVDGRDGRPRVEGACRRRRFSGLLLGRRLLGGENGGACDQAGKGETRKA